MSTLGLLMARIKLSLGLPGSRSALRYLASESPYNDAAAQALKAAITRRPVDTLNVLEAEQLPVFAVHDVVEDTYRRSVQRSDLEGAKAAAPVLARSHPNSAVRTLLDSGSPPDERFLEAGVAALTENLKELEPSSAEALLKAARTLRNRHPLEEVLRRVAELRWTALVDAIVEIAREGADGARPAFAALSEILRARGTELRPSQLQAICKLEAADGAAELAAVALAQRIYGFTEELQGAQAERAAYDLRQILSTTPEHFSVQQLELITESAGEGTLRELASEALQRRAAAD